MLEGQFSRTAHSARRGIAPRIRSLDGASVFVDPFATRILGKDLDPRLADARRSGDAAACACSSRCAAASPKTRRRRAIERGRPADCRARRGARYLRLSRRRRPSACGCSRSIIPRHRLRSGGGSRRLKSPSLRTSSSRPATSRRDRSARPWRRRVSTRARRAFFIWLGVTPYLTPEAVESTLRYVAGLPAARRSCSTTPIRPRRSKRAATRGSS